MQDQEPDRQPQPGFTPPPPALRMMHEPTAQQRSPWLALEEGHDDPTADFLALAKATAENDREAVRCIGQNADMAAVAGTAAKIVAEMLREAERDGECSHCFVQFLGRLAARP